MSKETSTARLTESTFGLLERFDLPTLDITNLADSNTELAIYRLLRNIEEEIAEVKREMSRGNFGSELFEELADVVVTSLNIPYVIGGSLATGHLLMLAIEKVILKNDSKTDKTHGLKNGKIQRR